ncbi:hypothetical protein [Bythopirellula goksoeyrii]|uniref:Uncharacterized protein n=1 Tax=Bythopirellula goksoeyrii TaxID=1400387 RepID=A0A5B9Q3A6_9BACT|nr:hypothetical protein [Bythopirellula goksoeyrii]QEG33508.1 hypothetical protein Pr1d_07720 [Bythopirellula goksoeyrii]
MSEPEKKQSRNRAGVFGVMALCLTVLQWIFEPEPTPEELRERREETIRRANLRTDQQFTKPGIIFTKREADGTFKAYQSLRVVDHDGLEKVQLKTKKGVIVWEKFLGDFPPANESLVVKGEHDQYACDVRLYVPRLPNDTYSIIVFDKAGNSFTKEAFFGDE